MTEQPPITEQPEDRSDEADAYSEIIDYYAQLEAQHAGRCVYHPPSS